MPDLPDDAWEQVWEEMMHDQAEVRDREGNAGCICKWGENFTLRGTFADVQQESDRRFEAHVASGTCPEKRDEEGNIIL